MVSLTLLSENLPPSPSLDLQLPMVFRSPSKPETSPDLLTDLALVELFDCPDPSTTSPTTKYFKNSKESKASCLSVYFNEFKKCVPAGVSTLR
mmetsp:Transcript_6209/g.12833  ORF Transcript_6209/g.12833 Transcript_6209/m.12833 type:complete len:93 (+) Transcript_6209:433-711(+)